jgi:hypothetical protein
MKFIKWLASFFSRPNAAHAITPPKHLPLKKTPAFASPLVITFKRKNEKKKAL